MFLFLFDKYLGGELLGLIRKCQRVLQSGCRILYFHGQNTEV